MIPAYPPPTEERFRALARSSPWRWSTLEFAWTDSSASNPRHAWVSKVRLDLQTGICVYAEYLGDTGGHIDHDLRILRVDEAFDDALFDVPPFPRWWKVSSRSARP